MWLTSSTQDGCREKVRTSSGYQGGPAAVRLCLILSKLLTGQAGLRTGLMQRRDEMDRAALLA